MEFKKLLSFTLLIALLLCATASTATRWQKCADLGFSADNPRDFFDRRRIKLNSLTVDVSGNVYATANNGTNANGAGGVTIVKTDGSKIDVDLHARGWQGPVTKLVTAGDGCVYALQNYQEVGYAYAPYQHRIFRINGDGSTDLIFQPQVNGVSSDKINGMAVGNDGELYWTMNGSDSYWRVHYIWKYDVQEEVVGLLGDNVDNGWGDNDMLLNLEATVGDYLGIVNSGGAGWRLDPVDTQRPVRIFGMISNIGFGRTYCTATAFDKVNGVLWTGALGTIDGSDRLVLGNWYDFDSSTGQASSSNVWHAIADVDMGQEYWISSLAVDADGYAWAAYGVDDSSTMLNGWRGKVQRWQFVRGDGENTSGTYQQAPIITDEGEIQAGADVVALGYGNGGIYATVLDRSTGTYSLYTTVPEPGSLAALGICLTGFFGFIRRRR